MKATKYGQVPVIIRRSTKGKENGNVILIYDRRDYYTKTTTIVRLSGRNSYRHEEIPLTRLRSYFSIKRGGRTLPLEEALTWLAKYCTYYRIPIEHFKLVSSFGRAVNGFYDIDLKRGKGEIDDRLS